MNLYQRLAKALSPGPSRLRSFREWLGCNRSKLCGLLTHLILAYPVHSGMLFIGIPAWGAVLLGTALCFIAACAVERAVAAKFRE